MLPIWYVVWPPLEFTHVLGAMSEAYSCQHALELAKYLLLAGIIHELCVYQTHFMSNFFSLHMKFNNF